MQGPSTRKPLESTGVQTTRLGRTCGGKAAGCGSTVQTHLIRSDPRRVCPTVRTLGFTGQIRMPSRHWLVTRRPSLPLSTALGLAGTTRPVIPSTRRRAQLCLTDPPALVKKHRHQHQNPRGDEYHDEEDLAVHGRIVSEAASPRLRARDCLNDVLRLSKRCGSITPRFSSARRDTVPDPRSHRCVRR